MFENIINGISGGDGSKITSVILVGVVVGLLSISYLDSQEQKRRAVELRNEKIACMSNLAWAEREKVVCMDMGAVAAMRQLYLSGALDLNVMTEKLGHGEWRNASVFLNETAEYIEDMRVECNSSYGGYTGKTEEIA